VPTAPRPKGRSEMASDAPRDERASGLSGPVLFAYDGSDLADFAIAQAGEQLSPGRDCLVVCVWQPSDVGFVPTGGRQLRAAAADEVRQAAEETADHGASLAANGGRVSSSSVPTNAPVWSGTSSAASPPLRWRTPLSPCWSCTADPDPPASTSRSSGSRT
jgi:hypothetical protein